MHAENSPAPGTPPPARCHLRIRPRRETGRIVNHGGGAGEERSRASGGEGGREGVVDCGEEGGEKKRLHTLNTITEVEVVIDRAGARHHEQEARAVRGDYKKELEGGSRDQSLFSYDDWVDSVLVLSRNS